jgi:hypothetical protein
MRLDFQRPLEVKLSMPGIFVANCLLIVYNNVFLAC